VTGSVQATISLPRVREEVLDILVHDDILRRSGQDVIESLSVETFVNLFKHQLQCFARELTEEAEQKDERRAAYAFWYHATYAARSACECWGGMEASGWTERLA
jgi:hypothetical protein